MAGNASERSLLTGENVEVAIGVASAAGIAGHPASIDAARRARRMRMHIVALGGPVARRMAVHAAWMHDHLRSFGEKRARAGLRVKDAREGRRAAQFDAVLRRSSGRTHEQKQNGAKPWSKRKHATALQCAQSASRR
jgi:hypothetical protein